MQPADSVGTEVMLAPGMRDGITMDHVYRSQHQAGDPGNEYEVIIIGAGIAGLGALDALVKAGHTNVLVVEARDYCGGRIKTAAARISDVKLRRGASRGVCAW